MTRRRTAAPPPTGSRPPLVLASASPQRRAILTTLGVHFVVREVAVDELDVGDPATVAATNAQRKALAASSPAGTDDELVLGVDTLVALDGRIHGKPPNEARAEETLRHLSGRTHEVFSGLALLGPHGVRSATVRTAVTFRTLDRALLRWYLDSGEWRGRAGGYAIQDRGAALVRAIEGDHANVVGLPVAALLDLEPTLLF